MNRPPVRRAAACLAPFLVLAAAGWVAGPAAADDGSAYVQFSGGASLAKGQVVEEDPLLPGGRVTGDAGNGLFLGFAIGVVFPGEGVTPWVDMELAYLRVNADRGVQDVDLGLFMFHGGLQVDLGDAVYLRGGLGAGFAGGYGATYTEYCECGDWTTYTDSALGFAGEVQAGVGVRLGDHADLFVNYRALWLGELEFDYTDQRIDRRDIIEAGVRLRF